METSLFLQYDYPETVGLLKQFLTLVSASLVFSVAFSEKIVRTQHAELIVRRFMFSAWSLFVLAIGLGGCSLILIAAAAGCEIYGSIPIVTCGGWTLALWSWAVGLSGGLSYGIGLVCLVLAARRSILVDSG